MDRVEELFTSGIAYKRSERKYPSFRRVTFGKTKHYFFPDAYGNTKIFQIRDDNAKLFEPPTLNDNHRFLELEDFR